LGTRAQESRMSEGLGGLGSEAPSGQASRPSGWRERVEVWFEGWGRFVCRQRWWVVGLSIVATVFCASFLPQITMDNSTESFLLPSDPAVVTYNAFRDEFARDDRLIIAIEGGEIFEARFLERLRALHRAIEEEVPYLDEVDSLLNARVTRGEGDVLVVGDLLEDWPETAADIARVREIALANPLYVNSLLSADGRLTTISIKPQTYSSEGVAFDPLGEFGAVAPDVPYLTAPESTELVVVLKELLARHEARGFEFHLAGALAMTDRLNNGIVDDLSRIVPMVICAMALLLALLFRRIGGVVLPLVTVVLPLINTLGIMVLLGIPGSTAIQILPIFLLTVGVCDAVHILTIAYRLRAEGASQEDAIARAVGHSGLAVVMTSLTTAAGMASFASAEMASVMHLGILAPIGITLALLFTLTLLPALLFIFPMATGVREGRSKAPRLDDLLVAAGSFALRSPWRVLFPTLLFIILMGLGAAQATFSHDSMRWFYEDDPTRVDFEVIDTALGGSVSVDVLIEAREPGGLYEPDLLRRIERIMKQAPRAATHPVEVGATTSIVDVVKEIHQALSGGDPAARQIPATRGAVAQELLLFEQSGSDDMAELVDSEYQRARINIRVPFVDATYFVGFVQKLDALVARELDGTADYRVTGLLALLTSILVAVIDSMARSYMMALGVITPLMMLLVGSLRRGFVSMFPNLIPVLAAVGLMGWLGVYLDSTTMMVGAMIIGLAVDDTIHFMHKFQRYFDETGDFEGAIHETLRTTGSALLVTTLVISAGFAMFMLAGMSNARAFGYVASFACIVAFISDLLVCPALLSLLQRHTTSLRPRAQGSITTLRDSESLPANAKASAADSRG
jgi:predicted RND superfamily exporter protein